MVKVKVQTPDNWPSPGNPVVGVAVDWYQPSQDGNPDDDVTLQSMTDSAGEATFNDYITPEPGTYSTIWLRVTVNGRSFGSNGQLYRDELNTYTAFKCGVLRA